MPKSYTSNKGPDGNRQLQREGWPAGPGEMPRSMIEVRQERREQEQQRQLADPETGQWQLPLSAEKPADQPADAARSMPGR